jgi:hypothetical protein
MFLKRRGSTAGADLEGERERLGALVVFTY